jgi:phosphatidylserine/phosphatidylglycerophosphate/cardiolipin synthase-like enzyme
MPPSEEMTSKWTAVTRAEVRPGNEVDYLIDGWATFESMYRAILTTLEGDPSAYYIYLLGWWLDDDFALSASDPDSTFNALMRRASGRGVQVRAMLWSNPFKLLSNPLTGGEFAEVHRLNALPGGGAIVDGHTLPLQSQHQKVLVVRGADGVIGFCGGLDVARDRVQSVPRHKGSPFHDVHVRIRGDAARDLVNVFAQRWNAAPAHAGIDAAKGALRGLADAAPVCEAPRVVGDQSVGIVRTLVQKERRCVEEASIGPTVINAIRAATRFIYLEEQYLVSEEAAAALGARLADLQHITILIPHSAISDLPRIWESRRIFLETLRHAAPEAAWPKLRVFFKYLPPTTGPAPEKAKYASADFGPGTYVHSKTWIFDDEMAMVGSANVNRRGWNYDSEVAAVVFDRPPDPTGAHPSFAQQLRIKLWAKHLQVEEARVVDPVAGAALWLDPAARRYVRPYDADEAVDVFTRPPPPLERALADGTPIAGAIPGPEQRSEGAFDIYDYLADPSPETFPPCSDCP